ncbi:MAG: signal peptidase I, partial [Clostridiales bacterium]|nr:signal peptidase I [Clostridiales bacterium]
MTDERKTIPGIIQDTQPGAVPEQTNTPTDNIAAAGQTKSASADYYNNLPDSWQTAQDSTENEQDSWQAAQEGADNALANWQATQEHEYNVSEADAHVYEDNASEADVQNVRRGFKYLLLDVLSVLVSAIVIAVILKTFVVDSRIVPTGSMIPTINVGNRVIILKLPYFFGKTPKLQDVVVFTAPAEFESKEDLLKRVIGLPGDTVEVKNNYVYVNGEPLTEEYLNAAPLYDYGKVKVPEGHYFMMGDNRNHSRDSHLWEDPFVPLSDI